MVGWVGGWMDGWMGGWYKPGSVGSLPSRPPVKVVRSNNFAPSPLLIILSVLSFVSRQNHTALKYLIRVRYDVGGRIARSRKPGKFQIRRFVASDLTGSDVVVE